MLGDGPKPLVVNAFKYSTLPSLPGVQCLSDFEVFSDIRELQRLIASDETDGDQSSIGSDEVLDSYYPVKPRKFIRAVDKEEVYIEFDRSGGETYVPEVEEALAFMQKVLAENKDTFDAEAKREEFNQLCESLKQKTEIERAEFEQTKSDQQAYLRLMQALLVRSLHINTIYSRKNMLLYRLYDALSQSHGALDHLDALTATVKPSGGRSKARAVNKPLVYVSMRGDQQVAYVTVRQEVRTPYGPGTVQTIHSDSGDGSGHVTLALPFGLLHATLPAVLGWVEHTLSESTLGGVQRAWDSEISGVVVMPPKALHAIAAALPEHVHRHPQTSDDASVASSVEGGAGNKTASTMSVDEAFEEEGAAGPTYEQMVTDNRESHNNLPALIAGNNHTDGQTTSSSLADISESLVPLVARTNPNDRAALRLALEPKSVAPALSPALLPLAFLPPHQLHSYVANLRHSRSGPAYDLGALEDVANGQPQLAWQGDLGDLRSGCQALHRELSTLQDEQRRLLSNIQHVSAQTKSLTAETAKLRVGMFTRRIAHRNHLSDHGINVPLHLLSYAASRGLQTGETAMTGAAPGKSRGKSRGSHDRRRRGHHLPASVVALQSLAQLDPLAGKRRRGEMMSEQDEVETTADTDAVSEKAAVAQAITALAEQSRKKSRRNR